MRAPALPAGRYTLPQAAVICVPPLAAAIAAVFAADSLGAPFPVRVATAFAVLAVMLRAVIHIADRRIDGQTETARANLAADFKAAERASEERGAKFWQDYERRNGEGGVDCR